MPALIGVHDKRGPAVVGGAFPGASVGREFVAGVQPPADLRAKVEALAKPWLTAGGQVYISFKPRPEDVAAGAWAPWLRKLGAWVADHPGVRLIVWHEPEDDMPGSLFHPMFNRCRDDLKWGWPGTTVAYCAMAYQWRKTGKAGAAPDGWQKVVADEYLVDVYSGVSFPETAILPEHPGFVGWYAAMVAPKLAAGQAVSWGLGERGFQAKSSETRATAIRREADWLGGLPAAYAAGGSATRPPMLYLAWNTGGTENDLRWLLDPDGESALRYLLAKLVGDTTPKAPGSGDEQFWRTAMAAGRTLAYAEMIDWARERASVGQQ